MIYVLVQRLSLLHFWEPPRYTLSINLPFPFLKFQFVFSLTVIQQDQRNTLSLGLQRGKAFSSSQAITLVTQLPYDLSATVSKIVLCTSHSHTHTHALRLPVTF